MGRDVVVSADGPARVAEVPALPRHVYLVADDLTGALDTAAQFVPLVGEIDVFWRAVEQDGSIALILALAKRARPRRRPSTSSSHAALVTQAR